MTPPGPPIRGQFRATVLANVPLCREHYRLVLGLPSFPPTEPGQFVQVSCRDGAVCYHGEEREIDWRPGQRIPESGDELTGPLAVLRRPFSLAGRSDVPDPREGGRSRVELDLIHRVVGVGTAWLSRLSVGDRVDILGPLGNRFTLPPPESLAILVGGGVGIPPMLYLAAALARHAGRKAVAFAGALTRDLLPLTIRDETSADAGPTGSLYNVAEFARHGIPAVLTTDDGSYGFRGFVTQALEKYLDESPALRRSAAPSPPATIYTCGPEPMMKRVAAIAAGRGLECQIAVERAMACGMGTCQSCCIRVKKSDPAIPPLAGRVWCYRLACTDGPVFRGAELLW